MDRQTVAAAGRVPRSLAVIVVGLTVTAKLSAFEVTGPSEKVEAATSSGIVDLDGDSLIGQMQSQLQFQFGLHGIRSSIRDFGGTGAVRRDPDHPEKGRLDQAGDGGARVLRQCIHTLYVKGELKGDSGGQVEVRPHRTRHLAARPESAPSRSRHPVLYFREGRAGRAPSRCLDAGIVR
jgi:hypothetical protein